jgi:Ca2+-binding RTX toxin-like protein
MFGSSHKKSLRNNQRTLQIQKLDDRRVMAGDISLSASLVGNEIIIDGSDYRDLVQVEYQLGGPVIVKMTQKNNTGTLLSEQTNTFNLGFNPTLRFDGKAGNDSFVNNSLSPSIAHGGLGDDFLIGGPLQDILFGDGGIDFIAGKDGDDRLHGGSGNDLLYGGKGVDKLYGDSGNDWLDGGYDNKYDLMNGGVGADTFVQHATQGTVVTWPQAENMEDFSSSQGDVKKTTLHTEYPV